jgi:hypothetical protein
MNQTKLVLLCSAALIASPGLSQTTAGNWELSLAGNLGSMQSSHESSWSSNGYTEHSSSDGDAQTYLGLNLRAGIFVADGFSLEPELYMLAVMDEQPAFNIGANASYTFDVPNSQVKPFLTAGYGIGNAIPLMQRLLGRQSGDFDIPVIRGGGGFKIFVSKQVALKIEYRYERYTNEDESSSLYYKSTSKTTMNLHNILFGFSVFLPGGE